MEGSTADNSVNPTRNGEVPTPIGPRTPREGPAVTPREGGIRKSDIKTEDINQYYKLGRSLGQGSFATVKVATRISDGTTWACKIINKSALNVSHSKPPPPMELSGTWGDDDDDHDDEQEQRERPRQPSSHYALTDDQRAALQVECDTMMKVDHDNIVRLKEVFDNKNKFIMVLEMCHGGELFDRIVELERYTEAEAANAFSQMLAAVGHCHKMGIIHRDLKPENLLYEAPFPSKKLKLADFGLAQIMSPGLTNEKCGTAGYCAPEIWKGQGYSKEVDMWSLGVILYIILCGFPPFYSYHADPQLKREEVAHKTVVGVFDFPSPYWDDVSAEAKDLVRKLLTVEPRNRYTAQQAFEHPWMAAENRDNLGRIKLEHFNGNMRAYNARRKFRTSIEGVMTMNYLKKLTNKRKQSCDEGVGGEGSEDSEGRTVNARNSSASTSSSSSNSSSSLTSSSQTENDKP